MKIEFAPTTTNGKVHFRQPETDLYEVKKAGEAYDELGIAYFVKPEDLEKYSDDEKVYKDDGSLVRYSKGYFIYRLAGRDREKSASYYTPEVHQFRPHQSRMQIANSYRPRN